MTTHTSECTAPDGPDHPGLCPLCPPGRIQCLGGIGCANWRAPQHRHDEKCHYYSPKVTQEELAEALRDLVEIHDWREALDDGEPDYSDDPGRGDEFIGAFDRARELLKRTTGGVE